VTIPAEEICIASVALAEPMSPSSGTLSPPEKVATSLYVTCPEEAIVIAAASESEPIVPPSLILISSLKVTIPAEEICIASVAPTEPTSPSLGTTTFPANVVEVSFPLLGLYSSPVSVSIPCDPVAPSTNVMYVVSSVELFADAVSTLALTSTKDITPAPFVSST
ncbi:uncharacterized protein METZ01_LOCUS402092, partial [marine metagenome]